VVGGVPSWRWGGPGFRVGKNNRSGHSKREGGGKKEEIKRRGGGRSKTHNQDYLPTKGPKGKRVLGRRFGGVIEGKRGVGKGNGGITGLRRGRSWPEKKDWRKCAAQEGNT